MSADSPHHAPATPEQLETARRSVDELSSAIADARQCCAEPLVIAWMGDQHVHAPRAYAEKQLGWAYREAVDCSANFTIALAELSALDTAPDMLVFGGDLADSGCHHEAPVDEYVEFGRILDTSLPKSQRSLAILGNHDHADKPLTESWRQGFAAIARPEWPCQDDPDDYYFQTVHDGWRFIGLDTRQGYPLTDRQRGWLGATLTADSDTPTVLLMHRPITSCGNWVDDCRLQDRQTFALVDDAPCIKLVMSGHTHHTAAWEYRGKTHLIMPSLAYGIPDAVGWGIVVLDRDSVVASFVKDLTTPEYYDCVSDSMVAPGTGSPNWRRLEPKPFAKDMLFNPCRLPR